MVGNGDTITLWRPTGQAELDAVAAAGWRAWPPGPPVLHAVLDRRYAARVARRRTVPAEGVGYVTRFDVERSYLDLHDVHRADGHDVPEYRIPAGALADVNAHLGTAITVDSEYRGPVGDEEFTTAGEGLPPAWRAYLQGPSWLRRGWLDSGVYLELNTPRRMRELHAAWDAGIAAHPGIAVIGGDGSRELLVLDLRSENPPVLLVDVSSGGWSSAVRQADDVTELIERIETGAFEFDFSDD